MSKEMKLMDITEFRDKGYLQEVNRQFLHPLGLALVVSIDDKTGEESIIGIWDKRDDPEGIVFGDSGGGIKKAHYVISKMRERAVTRKLLLGYVQQPAQMTKEFKDRELQGEWDVVSADECKALDLIGDRKIISGMAGHNILVGHEWGYFTVLVVPEDHSLILDYNDPRNSEKLRKVRDIIRRRGNGWDGRLYIDGEFKFTFRLEPVKAKKG